MSSSKRLQSASRFAERGYALTEVLVAAMIIALVIGAIAGGLSTSLQAARTSAETDVAVREAANIMARLQAGAALDEETMRGGWRLERNRMAAPNRSANAAHLEEIKLIRTRPPLMEFETVVMSRPE